MYQESMVEQARDLVLIGYTHQQLADFYNVHIKSIFKWKTKYPKFAEALNVDRSEYDSKVTRSLFELAVGYKYKEVRKEIDSNGFERKVTINKHMPPSAAAIKTWLYNRQSAKWRPEQSLSQKINGQEVPAPSLNIVYSVSAPKRAVIITEGRNEIDSS